MPEVSQSAFGKKKKQKKDRPVSGATIASAGGVSAGVGLAAGGVPGAKANINPLLHPEPRPQGKGVRTRVQRVKRQAAKAKAVPGGILGFRSHAHQGGLYDFSEKTRTAGKAKDASEAFFQGRTAGKIEPEEKILRHMNTGRKAAAVALAGGAGAVGYGVRQGRAEREKKVRVRKDRKTDQYHGALLGAGAAGAGVSHGTSNLLDNQKKKWAGRASANVDEAGRMVPSIAGRESNRNLKAYRKHLKRGGTPKNFPKTMYPKVTDSEIKRNPKLLKGVDNDTARKAGKLRGAAAQQRHFSEVYGSTAKVVRRGRTPSALVAAAGAGGLVASRKDKIKKSAFGVDHG